jgi:sugar phosphate isomerase/epimerase
MRAQVQKHASKNPAERDLLAAAWMTSGHRPTADPIVSPHDLRDRAQALAAAGYRGIGLSFPDLTVAIARHGHAGVKSILADNGLIHLELEALMGWFAPGELGRVSQLILQDMVQAAEKIGVRHIKATGDFGPSPMPTEAMASAFAPLARQAEEHGTCIALEIVAFSNINSLPIGLSVLGDTAGAGGGLMLDCWHFARANLPLDNLASLNAAAIAGVEISDIGAKPIGSLFEDTVDHRLICGEGVYNIPAFLRAVSATGYTGPIGVEVLSAKLRAQPLPAVAQQTFIASRAACCQT